MAESLFIATQPKKQGGFKMSFLETLLHGNNEKERKNKAACAAAIVITAILLVIAIIAFSICQIIDSTPAGPNDSNNSEREIETEPQDFGDKSANAVKEGLLVTLDDNHNYKVGEVLHNLQNRTDRPKTANGDNAYSVFNKQSNVATEETCVALNKMLTAFYKATKNEDLILADAYDTEAVDSQNPAFSAGTAVEFKYFTTAQGSFSATGSIVGVNEYKWLYNNAHKYGFVPLSADSNIFRYVGIQFATAIKASGLSFDAFIAKLKAATPENPVFLDSNKNYATYYCSIDQVVVPTNFAYDTDGDNASGVYVTVNFTAPKN